MSVRGTVRSVLLVPCSASQSSEMYQIFHRKMHSRSARWLFPMFNIWEGLPRYNWLFQHPNPTALKAVIFSLWSMSQGEKIPIAFKCLIQDSALSLYSSKELKKPHSHKGSGTPQTPAISAYSFLLCHLIIRTVKFLFLCPIICKACKKNVQDFYGIYHVLGSGTPM